MADNAFHEYSSFVVEGMLVKLRDKGLQYAPGDDELENFKKGGAISGVSPAHYLMIQATKHWYALIQIASGKRGMPDVKEVEERITDVMVYLLLLLYMFKGGSGGK